MKLYELAGIKQFKDLKAKQAIERIRREANINRTSLKFLGAGTNAVALTDGANVFKFWHRDSAYDKFVRLCQRDDSPYLPKFKSKVKTLPALIKDKFNKPIDVKFVKMELLKPWTGMAAVPIWTDPELIKQVGKFKNRAWFVSMFSAAQTAKTPEKTLHELFNRSSEPFDDPNFKYTEHLKEINSELIELLDVICKIVAIMSGKDKLDIREVNLARREDGHIVFLDPLANEDDLELNDMLLGLWN